MLYGRNLKTSKWTKAPYQISMMTMKLQEPLSTRLQNISFFVLSYGWNQIGSILLSKEKNDYEKKRMNVTGSRKIPLNGDGRPKRRRKLLMVRVFLLHRRNQQSRW